MEIYDASEILKMEADKLKVVIHIENPDKCRLCLKSIKNRIIITNAIRRKFLDVTQMELPTSDKLSKFVCSKCDKDLKDAFTYREKMIETQRKLNEEVGETRMIFLPEVVNLKQEKEESIIEEEYLDDDFGGCDDYSGYDNADDDYFGDQNDSKNNSEDIKSKTVTKRSRRRKNELDDTKLEIEIQEKKIEDENGRTYFVCDYCGKHITTAFSLKEHILTQHTELERKYACDHEGCGRSYVTQSRLRIHQLTHKDDKKAVCPVCGALLYSKKGLREHIASVHTKIKKYFCDKCEYSGTLKSRIRSHVKVHIEKENRRNHACHLCGFVSICPKSLKRHLFEHQGVEFTCHCGKTFNYKGALQMHIRCVHKKVKKHVCNICNKPFFNKIDLVNHNLVKHNPEKLVKNMPCEICGKLYGIEKQLARHRLYHHIRYECNYEGCDEYFNTEKRLERHMKKHQMEEAI
ncbi:hypothetical protein ACKWTF_014019 [Chironomus riparius]